ncbi:hypothetical protein PRZ48_007732 [Zasmidium cellare]|uniref:NmrA-like domain-containing protein n=1 Tax=Zasmidium cellare TaxID=395010 RepID=A0ABR0EK95_ZASCE|nr:hypothetical protein PRZ48_007732 [Zasmidium cellare]
MSAPGVIIFGPTGSVASQTALTAASLNAPITLAMRDPSKPIPGLTPSQEKSGAYTRLTADLTQPPSVLAAVISSNAKRAFIYAARGNTDHMKATIEALKEGGVEYVVFLSSFTVRDPPSSIPKEELIGYHHAQIEVNLSAIFGKDGYCAIRAGGFVTNALAWKDGILEGNLKLLGKDFRMDCITPNDMGAVAGNILVKGAAGVNAVYLYGPQNIPCGEVAERIGKVLGKDVSVESQSPEEAKAEMIQHGYPEQMAEYMVKARSGSELVRPFMEEGVQNVERYSGRKAMGLEEWVEGNRGLFV